jgi:hypothetical protein
MQASAVLRSRPERQCDLRSPLNSAYYSNRHPLPRYLFMPPLGLFTGWRSLRLLTLIDNISTYQRLFDSLTPRRG